MAIPIACTTRHATSIAMKKREMNLAERHPPFSETLPTRATWPTVRYTTAWMKFGVRTINACMATYPLYRDVVPVAYIIHSKAMYPPHSANALITRIQT